MPGVTTTPDRQNRRQRKAMRSAQGLLGPQPVLAYVTGRANARMTDAAWWTLGIFATVFVFVLVVLHAVVFPGVVLALFVYGSVRPHRGVAVTPAGVVVFQYSGLRGKPSAALAIFPFAVLWPPYGQPAGRGMRVPLGPDVVTLTGRDHGRLIRAVPPPPVMQWAAPPPPGTYAAAAPS